MENVAFLDASIGLFGVHVFYVFKEASVSKAPRELFSEVGNMFGLIKVISLSFQGNQARLSGLS